MTLRRDVPDGREDEIHAALQDTLGARLPGVRVVVTLGPPSGGGWDRRGRRDAGGNARR